jgi:hypothetical protein
MFETLKIKLFIKQPVSKVSSHQIDRIVKSQFIDKYDSVTTKLDSLNIDSQKVKNRIKAAILKLADGEFEKIDKYLDTANFDLRDLIVLAEYPRNWKHGFDKIPNKLRKKEYLDDWNEYRSWLSSFK